MRGGFFLTFEGLDGSGKTTQLRRMEEWLTRCGYAIETLRQPGGTVLGDRIRGLLLDSRSEAATGTIVPEAELALMFADRAQAIAQVIRPALAAGKVVLCDRYTDSSEAYQGAGRGLGTARVLALHASVCDNLQPDLTLLLLPPLAGSLARARRRNQRHAEREGADESRFEREGEAFYERIYAAYETIAMREPARVAVVHDDGTIDEVAERLRSIVEPRLAALTATERA